MTVDRRAGGPAAPGAEGIAAHGPDESPHVEVELKYEVTDPDALGQTLEGPTIAGLEAGAWDTRLVEDRYVDSADRDIELAGYAARLRRRGGEVRVGLKSLVHADGAVHRREEIEAAVGDGDSLDPGSWPASPARDVVLGALHGAPLEERFVLRQVRRVRTLGGEAGSAELSWDAVDVTRDGRPLGSFAELEVELTGGSESILEAAAREIERTGAVRPAGRSKFEAARALAEGETTEASATELSEQAASASDARPAAGGSSDEDAAPVRTSRGASTDDGAADARVLSLSPGRSPGVVTDDPLSEAARKVLRFHLARMLAAEDGTRSGEDPEDLHKMRVATRRMRAAWRVFDGAFRPRRTKRSVAGLRTLATDLGRVRDLDVLLDGLAAYERAVGADEAAGVAPLEAAWRHDRQRARDALVRYLDSDAYQRFVDEQVAFVRSDGLGAVSLGPTDPRRVRDLAPARLWDAYAHVRAFDATLRWADLPTLHALRIAGKRLRYAIEFFREPLGPEAQPLVERVTELQDHLGMLHDADVAAGLARAFLVRESARVEGRTVEAVGRYLADRERETLHLRRTLGPTWRRVTSVEFRRALGRSVARL